MWVETYPKGKMYNLDNFTELEEDCVQVKGSFVATLYGSNTLKREVLCRYVKSNRSLACHYLDSEIACFKDALADGCGFYRFEGSED